mmetsp:Transcript_6286/g.15628  ORF Transcript_6286/g.15628 Transcript_6286/m.15628 type:complete len:274 (+) Transcript_6286:205-1026(+)|eukprot:CAMPEP_0181105760 /NCGR_PEP_ID=MMETSP1071-20121207/16162_1 /TAXON_ID=35127 /ORGANISM="Thalassiosira sp., Strain NH16" /LENGTH=273 /DNA_ID=CAMNT_0023189105 /DNA_START=130 /DNA_END=951 /DNA_ORIENTATION=-
MRVLLDQAVDEWNSLVEREEKVAYQVQPSSSLDGQYRGEHSSSALANGNPCPPLWREKICEWCFQVIDHCDIDRDVVSIALSYFDRYLAHHTSIAKALYQLVAMTSLYLAVKLHSTRKISVSSMSALSKGQFRVDQILKIEISIIKTLRWHLNPPTPSMFLDVANPLIDHSDTDPQVSYEIVELSRYLLELSVCDDFFADKKSSSITYASLLVAMDTLSTPAKVKQNIGLYKLDKSPNVTQLCAQRLHHVFSLANSTESEEERAGASPTSVFQ